MTSKDQIEEMARALCRNEEAGNNRVDKCADCVCYGICIFIRHAEALYNADCRKQKKSVWSTSVMFDVPAQKITGYKHICQSCFYLYGDKNPHGNKFCPNCGAKMKGGE